MRGAGLVLALLAAAVPPSWAGEYDEALEGRGLFPVADRWTIDELPLLHHVPVAERKAVYERMYDVQGRLAFEDEVVLRPAGHEGIELVFGRPGEWTAPWVTIDPEEPGGVLRMDDVPFTVRIHRKLLRDRVTGKGVELRGRANFIVTNTAVHIEVLGALALPPAYVCGGRDVLVSAQRTRFHFADDQAPDFFDDGTGFRGVIFQDLTIATARPEHALVLDARRGPSCKAVSFRNQIVSTLRWGAWAAGNRFFVQDG